MRRTPLALVIAVTIVVAAAGTAIATSSSDSQANQPQVAGDRTSNTSARFPTNKQNEPTIAIAPDGKHVIAGANDEQKQPKCGPGDLRGPTALGSNCSFFPGVGTSGVYISGDTGGSWTNLGLLPGYTDTGSAVAKSAGALPTSSAPGTLVSDGDPVVVFGPKLVNGKFTFAKGARAYYANLAAYSSSATQGNQAPELLAVSISDNYGASWYDPVLAVSASGYVFNDKEDVWADRNPASQFFGRVYLSWTQFRSIPGTAEPVMFAYSTDAGLTWSAPNQITAAYNNGSRGGRQGSIMRSGPNGELYVILEDGDNLIGSQQVVLVSLDGGATFSKKISISPVSDIADPIPGANFRTDSFASAGVDQTTGTVYVAWSNRTGTSAQIVVSKGTNQGQTWSTASPVSGAEGYAFFQGLDVAPNGRVDIGYQVLNTNDPTTYGTGNAWIDSYYVSSINGGWSAPVKVSSARSDPAASSQNNLARQFWGDYNTMASTDATALFIYTDTRSGEGCAAVDAYQHYRDGSGPAVAKPAPGTDCPPQFGNSDAYVSKITP
ncbi:MAG: hypothetical protein NVSMB8_02340 [Candidatus Limnocylindrales bacterium]